ncbi:MAG: UDP-N-acetylmuramoyl-L-alanine--D-glutamate ligase [Burkholderiales bacterium]|nr:UDP-N-acetylmuramoyl-L-alanine--D-glutamate ligase [Burkholderiales bacterium]
MAPELAGRKVVVLGLGDTGLSMTRWLARRGALVRVADTRAAPPHAALLARELPRVPVARGAFTDETLRGAELIAISPGVDRREEPIARAIAAGVPVAGDVELFARVLGASREPPAAGGRPSLAGERPVMPAPKVVAVTGTNGKSTVTAMAGAMCRGAGLETVVAGNIGVPVLDALAAIEDGAPAPRVFVLELSSFQLESTASLVADAAAMLNLSEDHLDRYAGLADYAAAKERVFRGGGAQVLARADRWSMEMARRGRTVLTFGADAPVTGFEWGIGGTGGSAVLRHGERELLPLDALPVAGLHNACNALAAHALVHAIGVPESAASAALRGFAGLPHRLQRVALVDGVTWYDDSKGTNVGATVAALSGMREPVVLIAGGEGKGQDFAPLARAVAGRVRAAVLIGRDAGAIERALAGAGAGIERAGTMEEAVARARTLARPGDAVLLSPACASLDMFRNYVHRGEAFAAAVRALGGAPRERG